MVSNMMMGGIAFRIIGQVLVTSTP